MKRIIMLCGVLAVACGCMTVEPDPINDYPYGLPPRSSGPSSSTGMSKSVVYSSTDGRPTASAPSDWNSRSFNGYTYTYMTNNSAKPWANPPQSTATASRNRSSSASTRTAAKTDPSDDVLVKASYTETKPATAKPAAAKPPVEKAASKAEAESPPVNLGLLRLINSKRITVRYEVKDPASVGVGELEVWGTTDMRTWKKYDLSTRTPSSLAVEVPGEGLYGFTVVARAKGDAARSQPPSSEPPQMWVAVDLTKPVVQLLATEMSVKERAPSLVVRWNAKDRNLGPRPITLLYAERPEGPWSPIAANQENTGHYEWTMPASVPAQVCVRVQATDLMGNIGLAQSALLHTPQRPPARTESASKSSSPTAPSLTPPGQTNAYPIPARPRNPTVSILAVEGQ